MTCVLHMITINNEHEKTMRVSKAKTNTMKFYMTNELEVVMSGHFSTFAMFSICKHHP